MVEELGTLESCKEHALSYVYKYASWAEGFWCILCEADENGDVLAPSNNDAYTMYILDLECLGTEILFYDQGTF